MKNMNKIRLLLDKVVKIRMKMGLWLGGFRNIKSIEIVCSDEHSTSTFIMKEDQVIHTILGLGTKRL
jgi:hypothetical protein